MNIVRSNNLTFKYQMFTSPGRKDIGIRKFKFLSKTQCLTPYTGIWESKIFRIKSILHNKVREK